MLSDKLVDSYFIILSLFIGLFFGAVTASSVTTKRQASKWAVEKDSISSENLHLWEELRTCEITRVEDLKEMNAKITQMQTYYWGGKDSKGEDDEPVSTVGKSIWY